MINEYDINNLSNAYILDFYAEWCGPCRVTANNLAKFSDAHPEVEIYKVNVDKFPEVAEQYNVINLPTILSVENNEVKWRHIGLMTVKQMDEQIC